MTVDFGKLCNLLTILCALGSLAMMNREPWWVGTALAAGIVVFALLPLVIIERRP